MRHKALRCGCVGVSAQLTWRCFALCLCSKHKKDKKEKSKKAKGEKHAHKHKHKRRRSGSGSDSSEDGVTELLGKGGAAPNPQHQNHKPLTTQRWSCAGQRALTHAATWNN